MYMKRLVEFAEREKLLESSTKGYEYKKLDWIIKINLSGELKGFIKMDKNTRYDVPYRIRSGGAVRPFLFCDKPDYVLGWTPKNADQKTITRTKNRHKSFCDLIVDCAEKVNEPGVRAVSKFIKQHISNVIIPLEVKKDDLMTFQIDETDEKPIDLPSIQTFWEEVISENTDGREEYQCVVCGELCVPITPHKTDIVLPVGGRDRGKLISANLSAFESYGLKKSFTAPTCAACEEKYGRALVSLLGSETYTKNRMTFGNLVYLFWSKKKNVAVFEQVVQPDPEDVQRLRSKVFVGGEKNVTSFSSPDFYGLALSPNKARVVVRDWEETTLEKVEGNVYQFLQRQRIGHEEKYYGLYALVASLFRDARKEMTDNVPRLILKHAMFGKRLPESILYQAVNRCRSEKQVTRVRAGIMRLCLIQDLNNIEEDYLMMLEETETDVGYLCGRLFAVLEKIQDDAQGRKAASGDSSSVNTTVTDKFYGTASTAPASIFGMLVRNAQSHLSKLRKDDQKRGWAINSSRQLGEIAKKIKAYPNILSLRQQSMFSLGYLHQRDDFYKPKLKVGE